MENKCSFSLSTMWNVKSNHTGAEMLQQMLDLGFQKAELNYHVTKEMFQSMLPVVESGRIEITSVHNVFPRVDDEAFGTDSVLLGYPDVELRKKAIALTKRSVDYAAMLGARAVVIHPSEIPVSEDRHYDKLLKAMFGNGQTESPEYKQLYAEMIDLRKREGQRYLDLVKESLIEVCEHIASKNYRICLGLENRAMCHQIPDFEQMQYVLDELQDLPVYLWFDIGHGLMLEGLGMFDSFAEANKLKAKIIGTHIHDALGMDDHWAPCIYSDQLDRYLEIIKDIPIKVLELGPKNKPDEIKKAVSILEEKLAR